MTTYSSFEDATYEDLALAYAEEQARERDIDAELEDRFLARHEERDDRAWELTQDCKDLPF